MTLGYLLGGGVGAVPHGIELHRAFLLVRDLYDQISEWTGVPVEQMVAAGLSEKPTEARTVGMIREAAQALAVYELLGDAGVRPGAVGGLSLGAMTSSSIAGAVDRKVLLETLVMFGQYEEPAGRPAEALAVATIPVVEGIDGYCGRGAHGKVYQAGYFGPSADGSLAIHLLAGHLDALTALAVSHIPGRITILPGRSAAVHTPLRQHLRDNMASYVASMPIRTPLLPFYSCFEEKRLTTVDDVRDVFARNPVDPIDLTKVTAAMYADGVELGVIVGASIPAGLLGFPFPVVHVERPEDLEKAIATIYELGVDIAPAGSTT
ncbi:hypothetical protein [Kibdelosporangium aridum]|uniref:hypothetical protein n=1 Tax=Kibdelosporangium aridum TaxID=2030 RepID=UPI000526A3B7